MIYNFPPVLDASITAFRIARTTQLYAKEKFWFLERTQVPSKINTDPKKPPYKFLLKKFIPANYFACTAQIQITARHQL